MGSSSQSISWGLLSTDNSLSRTSPVSRTGRDGEGAFTHCPCSQRDLGEYLELVPKPWESPLNGLNGERARVRGENGRKMFAPGAVSKCTRTWIESPEQDADRLRTKFEEFKSCSH